MDKYLNRTSESSFLKISKQFPILLVTGPRQVGKTTFLKHIKETDRTYISLDDPLVRELATADPALFMQRYNQKLLIDEIQYAPQLLPYLKMAVDKKPENNQFWLTGSQQFSLMSGVSESLAGRVGIIKLLGFSYKEITGEQQVPYDPGKINTSENLSSISLKDLYELIWKGFFPRIYQKQSIDRDIFYSSYTQTYLQRDVRQLTNVGNEMAFLRFLKTTAARTAQLLNYSELARDTDISVNTAKHWISILEASGIIYLLNPYHTNITKRLVKTPKLYFLDTGLCSYLTEWSSPETLEAGAMSGAILETWVITELIKSYWHQGKTAPFYFYRDKDMKEIDLLISKDGQLFPVEIKKSASPKKEHVRHFSVLENLNTPIGYGSLICLTQNYLPLTENIGVIPVGSF